MNTSFVSMKNKKKERAQCPKEGRRARRPKGERTKARRPRGVKGSAAIKCEGPEAKSTENTMGLIEEVDISDWEGVLIWMRPEGYGGEMRAELIATGSLELRTCTVWRAR